MVGHEMGRDPPVLHWSVGLELTAIFESAAKYSINRTFLQLKREPGNDKKLQKKYKKKLTEIREFQEFSKPYVEQLRTMSYKTREKVLDEKKEGMPKQNS